MANEMKLTDRRLRDSLTDLQVLVTVCVPGTEYAKQVQKELSEVQAEVRRRQRGIRPAKMFI